MSTETFQESIENFEATNQLALYKAIYSSISDAIIYVDTDRKISLMNDSAIEQFGYSLAEVQGKTTQLFYANPEEFYNQGVKRYSKHSMSRSGTYEVKYKRKNGEIFVGETLGSHVYNSDGSLIGYMGVIRDVTERNKALEQLGRFGRIIEDSLNEVYLFDEESLCFIDANRGARENLGYSIQEMHHMAAFNIKPEFSEEEFKQMIEPLRNQSKKIQQFETFHQRKDGSTYPVEVHLQRVNLEDDYFFLAIILDITERKKTELELNKHRDHLEQLVTERSAVLKEQAQIINQIHDSVISTDLNGFISSWNSGASKLYGYAADEMLGKHISELYPEKQRDLLENDIILPLKEKGEHEVEIRMQKKDGTKFYSHLSLSLLYDSDNKPKGMVGYSIDISARKKAEDDARKHANELAIANEELRRFNYSVSHDLKAPLRAIDGFSSVILDDFNEQLTEQGKDYLNRIRMATQRMGRLIEDMLNLSRVSLEEMSREKINLSEMVAHVLSILQERSNERNVDIKIQQNIFIHADKGLTQILVENLMDNAWKYTSQNLNATIEFGQTKKNKNSVLFIKDNGIGFDTKYANRLFDPFQRLHNSKEFSGSGVGLATVQTIVHRHHGRIWAESQLNEGTTFYFTLPLR